MPVSHQMSQYVQKSSFIRAMFEAGAKLKAEKGPDKVYDFSLGNPMLEPPEAFKRTLARLAAESRPGQHGYMPNAGYPAVRQKVADYLSRQCEATLSADEVVMTVGAGGALNIILKTLLNPDEEVVVPTPYFVEYDFYAANYGATVRRVPTKPDFTLDLAALGEALGEKTGAVLINSPNNPTGTVYSREELTALAKLLGEAGRRRGRPIYLISDEPYRQVIYDGVEVPWLFDLYADSLVATSFSKDLSLAGERLGYVAVNPNLTDKAQVVAGLAIANRILGFVNAPALMQRVVAEVLGATADLGLYAKKRDLICQVLSEAGFEVKKPAGAFYLFPRTLIADDVAFCRAAQEECILIVPGSGFMGPGHFRLAYCCEDAVIERSAPAFKRLRAKF